MTWNPKLASRGRRGTMTAQTKGTPRLITQEMWGQQIHIRIHQQYTNAFHKKRQLSKLASQRLSRDFEKQGTGLK